MLTLTVSEWTKIRKRLKADYAMKPSIFLIRETMKRELGFLPRYHRTYSSQRGSEEVVYIDFFDDTSESYFRLKYL
jgi:hypothetical protein